jgi:glycosyltransferase involved in cell wall biosynthesis
MLILDILRTQKRVSLNAPLLDNFNSDAKVYPDKIIFIGMIDSPHFVKWLKSYTAEFPIMKVLIFPSDRPRIFSEKDLRKMTGQENIKLFKLLRIKSLNFALYYSLDMILGNFWRAYFLGKFLQREKPKILHIHETQHGAYIFDLVAQSKSIPRNMYKILSTWGSDLIFYSTIEKHRERIKSCLKWVDVLTSERADDFQLAAANGFEGKFIAPMYITIGSESTRFASVPPSKRKIVMLKGYQNLIGRSLNALAAIKLLSGDARDYEFIVYSASPEVKKQVNLMNEVEGIDIKCIERVSIHEMEELFSRARVAISLAISDGLPSSFVEAMKSGAFPIQSSNSAAVDFLDNGIGGFLVNPEDINEIRNCLQRALVDDELVDSSQGKNLATLEKKYSLDVGRKKLRSLYLLKE